MMCPLAMALIIKLATLASHKTCAQLKLMGKGIEMVQHSFSLKYIEVMNYSKYSASQSLDTLTTTLPKCFWLSWYSYALRTSSNANTLSTTGFNFTAVISRFSSSNLRRTRQ